MSTFSRLLRFFSKRGPSPRGFTLIELLVVSAIIVLITGFVLFRQQGFNSSTLLRSLSYSIALTVRQAQVYGVSVRESAVGSNVFASGYGVSFGNSGLVDSSHYVLFADANGDGQYAAGEELPRFTIGNGRGTDYLIKNICAHSITSGDQCSASVPATSPTITSLTAYFRRPNPDACFSTSQSPSACAAGATPVYDYAYVQVRAFAGADYRTIKISNTGQIAVCKPNLDSAGVAAC
jgi:prepilin-type N-terminal cleavage/methylation domain-containing protein